MADPILPVQDNETFRVLFPVPAAGSFLELPGFSYELAGRPMYTQVGSETIHLRPASPSFRTLVGKAITTAIEPTDTTIAYLDTGNPSFFGDPGMEQTVTLKATAAFTDGNGVSVTSGQVLETLYVTGTPTSTSVTVRRPAPYPNTILINSPVQVTPSGTTAVVDRVTATRGVAGSEAADIPALATAQRIYSTTEYMPKRWMQLPRAIFFLDLYTDLGDYLDTAACLPLNPATLRVPSKMDEFWAGEVTVPAGYFLELTIHLPSNRLELYGQPSTDVSFRRVRDTSGAVAVGTPWVASGQMDNFTAGPNLTTRPANNAEFSSTASQVTFVQGGTYRYQIGMYRNAVGFG